MAKSFGNKKIHPNAQLKIYRCKKNGNQFKMKTMISEEITTMKTIIKPKNIYEKSLQSENVFQFSFLFFLFFVFFFLSNVRCHISKKRNGNDFISNATPHCTNVKKSNYINYQTQKKRLPKHAIDIHEY